MTRPALPPAYSDDRWHLDLVPLENVDGFELTGTVKPHVPPAGAAYTADVYERACVTQLYHKLKIRLGQANAIESDIKFTVENGDQEQTVSMTILADTSRKKPEVTRLLKVMLGLACVDANQAMDGWCAEHTPPPASHADKLTQTPPGAARGAA